MRLGFILISLYFLLPRYSVAQPEEPACSVNTTVKLFYADRLNRVYVVNPSGLFQYDSQCNQTASFTKRINGGITSVDVSNPLKILVFSQAEQKIYLLNDQLHLQSAINLSDLGVMQATLVCHSRSDGFRVFDQATLRLLRFDYNLNRIQENDLSQAFNEHFEPVMMAENEKIIAISNHASGVLFFDRFGNYIQNYSNPHADRFYLTDTHMAFTDGDKQVSVSPDKYGVVLSEPITDAQHTAIKINNRWVYYDATGFSVSEK